LSNLLKSLKAGSLSLTNRLVLPPMATSNCPDGIVTEGILDYYKEKSQGGYISLIIIEHSYIAQEGRAGKGQISIADNYDLDKLKELSDIIHNNGTKAVMQISHAGIQSDEEITGFPAVGPSAILNPKTNKVALELTALEIQNIIKAFGAAAKRVKDAGFDGVEIHSAHGYLLNQFFSPLTNKRTDAYGGDVINRIKIHLEVIEEVRKAVGEDFPVLLRLGASDYTEGGSTIDDSLVAAKEFEKAGIEILDISGGFCGYKIPGATEEGYFSPLTEAIKKVVNIPVILTGGIVTPKAAEELLASGKADLVGVGRAILTNSNWAKNAIESLK
jgi:2,4-dienoyl-CoA reductase-like NADH-dependent reductase (Old Yellow Enzyme family)